MNTKALNPARRYGPFILIAELLVLLYGVNGNAQEPTVFGRSAIRWMVMRWSGAGGDLSHCWVIPIVSAVLVWRKRRSIAAAPKTPSHTGLLLVVLSLLLHWVGVRSQLTRLSLLSLVGLSWGVPYALYGAGVARLLLFPCAYLVFCIPLSFLNDIALPLRMIASSVATWLLNGFGIPAHRIGTAIYSQAGGGFCFDVADACSGLRSLLAMTALTAVYAYLTQRSLARKIVLFLLSAPLAMAGNIFRILAIGLVAQVFSMERALGLYHDYSGFLVFAVAILLMVWVGELLRINYREKLRQWKTRSRAARS